jgi:hypothetical protein
MNYKGKEIFDAPRATRLSGPTSPFWAAFISAAVADEP